MFGPKDISFVQSRFIRLKNLIYLFKNYGYKPAEDDHISGYKLICSNDLRFVITAGAHRASVFKCMYENEKTSIKVKFDELRVKKNFQVINLEDIDNWPGVKSGYTSKYEAKNLFLSYFKFKKNIYET